MPVIKTNRFAIVSLLLTALASCGDGVTSVRLQIVAAPSLVLDGLAITVDGARHEQEMTASLQLLVPDGWAGVARHIDIAGTHGGATVAVGAVVVTPIVGQEVIASVTLVDPSCDLICSIGELRCEGDGVVSCEFGADECPSWSEPTACPSGAPFCSNGSCAATCTDECTSGATMCEGATNVRTCGQADSDPCLDWSSASCPASDICASDACTPAVELTVVKAGAGIGTVTSSPSRIVCGTNCTAAFALGTQVTLTATQSAGFTFTGWSGGGCSGTGTCIVTLSAATKVTAAFAGPQVDAGSNHTCAVKTNGTVTCWGEDDDGEATPPAGSFVTVSAGSEYACGVKTNGTLACWGYPLSDPVPPAGTFATVSTGGYYRCGIKTTGAVACWGLNGSGQATPPAGMFASVSAGDEHTCGVKIDGTVACWGGNKYGQSSPPAGTFATVSAGGNHSCGVRTTGAVACWGSDEDGVASPPGGVFVTVSAGLYHNCGVKTDGTVACWGGNQYGQSSPPAGTFASVSAGAFHNCGLTTTGAVACWGDNRYGQTTPP